MLLLSVSVNATELRLNLNNPDVRKCLLEASENEGWALKAVYQNANEHLVYVFEKGKERRTYVGL